MSLLELPEQKLRVMCVYTSSKGQFDKFLSTVDLVLQKLLMKGKTLILCGNWNIHFLHGDATCKT
jgi:exonuclease III